MNESDYYCVADDGLLWKLGNHGDIEAADDTAASIGLRAIWIIDEKAAEQWRDALIAPDLLDLLCRALPYVEDAEQDPCNKPEAVRKLAHQIRAAIERAS